MRMVGFLLAAFGKFWCTTAFVLPAQQSYSVSKTAPSRTIRIESGALQALPLSFAPYVFVATSLSSSTLHPASLVQSWIGLDTVLTATVLTVILVLLAKRESYGNQEQLSNDDENTVQEPRSGEPRRAHTVQSLKKPSQEEPGTMGRRGTLTTIVGGALSFAASDMLLGRVLDVGSGMASTVYGARWNGLYSRIAQASTAYGSEAAVASPELLAFISKSSAALTNPELRAWIAAQRAFNKSRALVAAAGMAIADEGIVAAAATRTAAATVTAVAVSVASDSTTGHLVDDGAADPTSVSLKADTLLPAIEDIAELPLSSASAQLSNNDDENQVRLESDTGELSDKEDTRC